MPPETTRHSGSNSGPAPPPESGIFATLQQRIERASSDPETQVLLRRALLLLVLVPAIWLGHLIDAYGVDTPYWDEWDEVPAELVKIQAGNLHFADLAAPHNEHRILFPRLIMLAAARLTSWNVRTELFIIWLLACICSFNLWQLTRVTGWRNSNRSLALLAAANLLLFTPMAFENWLWGFQIGFLQPLACLTLAIWLVASRGPVLSFFYAIALSLICTFSIASGFLCWLITLPLLLFPHGKLAWRNRIPGLIAWLIGLVGSLTLYLHGYVPSTQPPSLFQIVVHPAEPVAYILAYLGNPFTRLFDLHSATFLGGVLVALFFGAIGYIARFRADAPFVARTLPWIMLSTFAVMNAVITMIGRVGYGSGQALGPRYITFAVMLPIGLLFTYAAIYQHAREHATTPVRIKALGVALTALAAIGLSLNLYGSICVLDHWDAWKHARITSQVLMEFIQVTNEAPLMTDQHLTYGDYGALRDYSASLGEVGYLRPAPLKTAAISTLADLRQAPTGDNGVFDGLGKGQNGQIYAMGWAVLPEQDSPADAIVLTYDNSQGEPTIFDVAFPGYPRADVSQARHDANYLLSGWVWPLRFDQLPPGAHILRAWAFDVENNRAYPLQSVVDLAKKTP